MRLSCKKCINNILQGLLRNKLYKLHLAYREQIRGPLPFPLPHLHLLPPSPRLLLPVLTPRP